MGGIEDGIDGDVKGLVWENELEFKIGKKIEEILGEEVKIGMKIMKKEKIGLNESN